MAIRGAPGSRDWATGGDSNEVYDMIWYDLLIAGYASMDVWE